jgi:hypothetical protein
LNQFIVNNNQNEQINHDVVLNKIEDTFHNKKEAKKVRIKMPDMPGLIGGGSATMVVSLSATNLVKSPKNTEQNKKKEEVKNSKKKK